MKLKLFEYENSIEFDNYINIICFENKKEFASKIEDLYRFCEGEEIPNKFALTDNGNLISLSKTCLLINDILGFNLNDKKVLQKIYYLIYENYKIEDESEMEFNNCINNLKIFFQKIMLSMDLDLNANYEVDLLDLMKVFKPSIDIEDMTFKSKIFNIIDLCSEVNLYKIIIFRNIKALFDISELEEIYKYSLYKKIHLLLLEQGDVSKVDSDYEKILFIDKDYDEHVILKR